MAKTTKEASLPTDLRFEREDIEQSIPQRFEHVVWHSADRVALTYRGQRWTYLQLNRRINQIANAIREQTQPGIGCVSFLAEQSSEMVIAALAVLKAGKAYLAIHPQMPNRAQQEIIRDAAPQLLLTTRALTPRAHEIAAGVVPTLILDDIGEGYSEENPPIVTKAHDSCTIIYTSGTTGQPKGVVKSHRAILHRVWLSTRHDEIVPSDRQSLLTHCSFSASESDVFAALLQGATVCVFDIASEGLTRFGSWINEERITLLHPPVLLFRRFLSTLEDNDIFPSVRLVALAGDTVLPGDLERWKRHFTSSCVVLHRYSLTETALLTVAPIGRDTVIENGTVVAGRPVADKSVALVDEAGQAVANGDAGEIVVHSSYLAEGYWNQPEATAAAFKPNPEVPGQRIYRTGDLGRFLPDGSLVLLGRRDHHLVKIRGYRVDTREVESTLMQLPEIVEAAAVVRKEDDQNRLWGFVVMARGMQFDPSALRTKLRSVLPEWKIPARFRSVSALPMTLNGKVDKQLLSQAVGKTEDVDHLASGKALSPSIEQELAEIWKVTLNCDQVGLDDNFLDLGGDSISAMMTLNRIERHYGVKLTFAVFFQHATIRQLATLLRSGSAGKDIAVAIAADTEETELQEQGAPIENVADAYVELLNAHAVDYVFINPGTDTAPILESIAKFKAMGRRTPELVLCLHESLAMAAAHGYFMATGRPQVVMVHVDVGTQNLGANLHNAQRGRAGVVICAGRAPYTFDGSLAGGRNRYNHWIQEQFNQAGIVQGYVKWHYELTCRENLRSAVERAFQIAGSEPAGPVYLTLPREVLLQKMETPVPEVKERPSASAPVPDRQSLSRAARWLIEAENPLILVAYAGRNPNAVAALVQLAETLAIPVVETRHRVNFPSAHPLHIGFTPARYLLQADCVLVVDHDVPWVPAQCQPSPDCKIIQLDIDTLKRDIPIWGFPVNLAIQADSSIACADLAKEVDRQLSAEDRAKIEMRRHRVTAEHQEQWAKLRQRTLDLSERRPIAPEWAAHCLNEIVDENTVIIGEAVSNGPTLWNQLRLDKPGTYYQSSGSGLGWALGAALGAKLSDPSKTVICVVGDGSWLFGEPIAAYWAAEQNRSPFLTVIFDNQEYFATIEAILTTAPGGYARRSGRYPMCDLPKPPQHSKVAASLGLWARTVDDPAELPSVLQEALNQVRRGRSALVDIMVSSARPGPEE